LSIIPVAQGKGWVHGWDRMVWLYGMVYGAWARREDAACLQTAALFA